VEQLPQVPSGFENHRHAIDLALIRGGDGLNRFSQRGVDVHRAHLDASIHLDSRSLSPLAIFEHQETLFIDPELILDGAAARANHVAGNLRAG